VSDTTELRLLNEQIAEIRALLLVATGSEVALPDKVKETLQRIHIDLDAAREFNQPPTATVSLPETCGGVPERSCGLRSDDARISKSTFSAPLKWRCLGCRVEYDQ
jgi:hypothetical protein